VTIRIPVQTFAGPVVNSIHRDAGSRSRGEQQRSGETVRIGRAENQIAIAGQNAYVVAVLVERMLPTPRADDAQQRQLTRMHVRIAVVRLVRIFRGIVRIHEVRHRAPVDHEIGRNVRLGGNVHAAGVGRGRRACPTGLFFRLAVNPGIHLGVLEEVFPVVASSRVVVRCVGEPEIGFAPETLRRQVGSMHSRIAGGGDSRGEDNDCPI
jgi:hypothetical protein